MIHENYVSESKYILLGDIQCRRKNKRTIQWLCLVKMSLYAYVNNIYMVCQYQIILNVIFYNVYVIINLLLVMKDVNVLHAVYLSNHCSGLIMKTEILIGLNSKIYFIQYLILQYFSASLKGFAGYLFCILWCDNNWCTEFVTTL